MMGDNFFEQFFSVWESFGMDKPFELTGDGALLGKVLEVVEMEGDARLEVQGNGLPNVRLPSMNVPIRQNPFWLRQGVTYRITLHIRFSNLPEGVVAAIELWSAIKPGFILLSTEVLETGAVVLFVMPVFRTQLAKGFPIATLKFGVGFSQSDIPDETVKEPPQDKSPEPPQDGVKIDDVDDISDAAIDGLGEAVLTDPPEDDKVPAGVALKKKAGGKKGAEASDGTA